MDTLSSTFVSNFLVGGAVNSLPVVAAAFLLSRFGRDILGRAVLAFFLCAAGAMYVVFAVGAGAGTGWTLVELAQVLVLGTMALLGLRRSPYWLAAGWAIHPFWGVLLHLVGPGNHFAPASYAISCITWDWVVALYIVAAYRPGGQARFRFRRSAPEAGAALPA
ncbi:hypothetical protein HER39_09445 [Arthrobacter deserti]|uniref:Uncharacterized protein n=1 Tax=Arthrobacter deserti TaxID=1742687 RepID=A0ABX1JNA8_9MICC|nr:hypothetical protein [Arthrobacter deserti]